MSIKDDYQEAVELAKQGKYQEARNLLIAHDHPKTNALLDKVNAAIASGGTTGKRGRGCLRIAGVIVLIVLAAGVGLAWYYDAFFTYNISAVYICLDDELDSIGCDEEHLTANYLPEMRICRQRIGDATLSNTYRWIDCLNEQGVQYAP